MVRGTANGKKTYIIIYSMKKVFEVIEYIHDYETENFGEVNTTLSNPESVANMFAYIRGEELLADREEKTTWRG